MVKSIIDYNIAHMKIILTHEQADFDALSSQLGAYLLDEAYIPVLPRKVNRNVRAFLTLYGVDLPFIEARDLPIELVESVKLVDTQSMISVRGMTDETQVHVIDHHPLREDLPAAWNITLAGTGANTTIFIESLRERDIILTPIQSTLLLLGIYEDTGSLTYSRTTARDLRAAGVLIEQGASLQIATDFLNHPLSQEQQNIYDRLRNSVEYHNIHGHNVIIACGDAQEMDEELSTIAHKLRDLLDPDALFVLIVTRGGVQLIARSTSDNIDVAEISGQFGGGGHERAAAAIITNRSIEDIYKQLVDILPQFVQPAITVAQIMSRSPQILSPDTAVDTALSLMQRTGHEGFPIVDNGQVIGLLTRRAVDRAISHKLHLPAEKLMDAGELIVRPDDSIEHLQKLMTDSGWGQVPVVATDSGEIIGIVTRTDLLKTLTPTPRIPSRQNLANKLERALPAARLDLIRAVADMAHELYTAVYIVGGFVRDLILDRPSLDFDLVVEGDAVSLAKALVNKFGGRVTSHTRFGTAKWLLQPSTTDYARLADSSYEPLVINGNVNDLPNSLDLVSARTEFYKYPTALPTVEQGSIKLDLHRRDFTINTLALRLDGKHYGELHDYWGGLADLNQGIVRVLHSLSFIDDPTRILRAVRFEQRFGFRIEPRTLKLLREARSMLDRVSGDRIRHELNIILSEENMPAVLSRLDELGVLAAIHDELIWDSWLHRHFKRLITEQPGPAWLELIVTEDLTRRVKLAYIIWFVRVSQDRAKSVCERLKLSAELQRIIQSTIHLWQELPMLVQAKPSEITKRLDEVNSLGLYAIYLSSEQSNINSILLMYIQHWHKVTPSITGHDLRARGLPPGPIYRRILDRLRIAWLDGEVTTIEEESRLINTLLDHQNFKTIGKAENE